MDFDYRAHHGDALVERISKWSVLYRPVNEVLCKMMLIVAFNWPTVASVVTFTQSDCLPFAPYVPIGTQFATLTRLLEI